MTNRVRYQSALAVAVTIATQLRDDIIAALALCIDPGEDPRGKDRESILENLEHAVHEIAIAVGTAREAHADMKPSELREGEWDEEDDEDDEDDAEED